MKLITKRKANTIAMTAGLALAACSGGASDGRSPMGSQALTTSTDFSALYVANASEDSVTRVDIDTRTTRTTPLEGEPTRIARTEDRILVTLRAKRAVAVLNAQGTDLVEETRINVGAEPFGIVATEDGARFYVVSSLSGLVQEFDGLTLEVLRAWTLPNEPRWVAVHPSGQSLYVAAAQQGALYWIDLTTGKSQEVELPILETFGFGDFDGTPEVPRDMSNRITGDPTVLPDGKGVAVPMLIVDNKDEIPDETAPDEGQDPFESGGYGGKMNPVVMTVPVDGSGKPKTEPVEIAQISNFEINSYPASVTISPDNKYMLVTLEGAQRVAVLPVKAENNGEDIPIPGGFGASPRSNSLAPRMGFRQTEFVGTGLGPRAVAFTSDNDAHVYTFIDRQVATIDMKQVRDMFSGNGFFDDFGFAGPSDAPTRRGEISRPNFSSGNGVEVAQSTLTDEIELGRRLFYTTIDPIITTPGAGVSCATCHFDGRNDGLTWRFTKGLRQTPSLAGKVSDRAPVRWQGEQPSVADDALFTSQTLMGGQSLRRSEALAIEAFVDWGRRVDVPLSQPVPEVSAQIDLGREVFFREEVGCGNCHNGALLSDLQTHDILGLRGVKTPSLLGIAATAPYFHDGSAPNIRALLERVRDGSMGDTSSLNEEEMSALEIFVSSL